MKTTPRALAEVCAAFLKLGLTFLLPSAAAMLGFAYGVEALGDLRGGLAARPGGGGLLR